MYIKFCRNYLNPSANNNKQSDNAKNQEDDIQKKLRVYQVASIVLFFITLIFAAVIFGLLAQRQTGMICPSVEIKVDKQVDKQEDDTCSVQVCRGRYPESMSEKKGPECRRCDPGWLSFGNFCYFLSQVRETWSGARENCRLWQADLAVIHSLDVQVFLTQKGNIMYWIGLSQPRAGEWVWVNHTALGQSYWSPGGDHERCTFLIGRNPYRTSWQSSSCDSYVGYICQKAL